MCNFYKIFLLSLLFIYSVTSHIQTYYSNRTIVSSRSIYDLVQIRRAAARWASYHNKTHGKLFNAMDDNTYSPRSKIIDLKDNHNRFLIERLKIIMIISSISLGLMIVIVIICIIARYSQSKHSISTGRFEQRLPLKSSNRIIYSEIIPDTRNFACKSRTLPTNV